jgi:Cu2+-exporting ATPase
MIGAAAMSLSSFCVVSNALRLNLFKLHDAAGDKPVKTPVNLPSDLFETEEELPAPAKAEPAETVRTLYIDGMMCDHCEKRIKESLEALSGVAEVTASSDTGTAVVRFTAPVEYEALEKAVADAGYTLLRAEDAGAAPACVRTLLRIDGMVCENCEAHVSEAV